MMLDPKSYIESMKDEPFENLIEARNTLIDEIKDLEEIALKKGDDKGSYNCSPSPGVKYQVEHEYLAELCLLIRERYNSEYVWEE